MSRFKQLENTQLHLPGVETLEFPDERTGRQYTITVALPPSYGRRKRRRYPLLLSLDANVAIGSVIETCRTMGNTREIQECIVVGIGMPDGDGQDAFAWRRLWEYSPPTDNWTLDDDFGRVFAALAPDMNVSLSGTLGAADHFARFISDELLPWCCEHYRVRSDNVALFGHSAGGTFALYALLTHLRGIRHYICGSPGLALSGGVLWNMLETYQVDNAVRKTLVLGMGGAELHNRFNIVAGIGELPRYYHRLTEVAHSDFNVIFREFAGATHSSVMLAVLAHGLRCIWPTGRVYGQEMAVLGKPWAARVLQVLRPLVKSLQRRPDFDGDDSALFDSVVLERQFEVFVSLPASYASEGEKRYPMLLVLDANFAFSTVADQAALMARTGEIQEMIVVGLGVPGREGEMAFALRRLEEFSPPADGYGFNDELGRILSSLFAVGGMDIREHFGKAPQLLWFITEELLPKLLVDYRIDSDDLGIVGHSAGGTFVAYALQAERSPFRRYICGSPGLGISGSWLLQTPERQALAHDNRVGVFIGIGEEEFENTFNGAAGIPATQDYVAALSKQSGVSVQFRRFPEASHTSVFPGLVASGLLSLWGTGVHYGDDVMALLEPTEKPIVAND